MSVHTYMHGYVTARMVYFGAYARSGIFHKNARELGLGRVQFYARIYDKKTTA